MEIEIRTKELKRELRHEENLGKLAFKRLNRAGDTAD